MKIILLIIITLFIFIILTQKIKFSSIYESANSNVFYESSNSNNVEFIITYTTPSFYTSSAANDLIIPQADKRFQKYPLLMLYDATNCPVAADGTRSSTINNMSFVGDNPFKTPSCSSIFNMVDTYFTGFPVGPAESSYFVASHPDWGNIPEQYDRYNANLYNIIDNQILFYDQPLNNSVITGDSTKINKNITLKIPAETNIVRNPLKIDCPYILGISIANNQSNSRTTFGNDNINNEYYCNKINNGTKSVLYSRFIYKDFMITKSMFSVSQSGYVSDIASVNIDFNTLSFT